MILGRSSDTYQLSHPIRGSLKFIVISVMSSIFSDIYRILYMTMDYYVFGDRHAIVMLIVMEKTS